LLYNKKYKSTTKNMDKKIVITNYCVNNFVRKRFPSREIKIGTLNLGGNHPIRVQSMTTLDTMDTEGTVKQSIRMIEAGCELVRLTAPSKKEAENLGEIKKQLIAKGYHTPLVADIHFTPNAAEIAAKLIEKVRVNPGNYADKKKFEEINYTDESYQAELIRIEKKFTPLVLLCKEKGTSMRIGTNHGSLSDRILSRFGDTPEGMVESALEFIQICAKNNFHDLVISMKASNTLIMVHAYRLLVQKMIEFNLNYPLHLGVTEAGDGEDGRIKSAVGIGALLEDGLGDTIRVSLTEEPEYEIPVAQKLIEKFEISAEEIFPISTQPSLTYNPFSYNKRESNNLINVGGKNHPVVLGDLSDKSIIKEANLFAFGYIYSKELDKWNISDQAIDYLYLGDKTIDFNIPGTLRILVDNKIYQKKYKNNPSYYPYFKAEENYNPVEKTINFKEINAEDWNKLGTLSIDKTTIIVLTSQFKNKAQLYRRFRVEMDLLHLKNPVILKTSNTDKDLEKFQLAVSSELGINLIDGFGDGIFIQGKQANKDINTTSFGILQATRTRISKTEYISCPSCGRTLFDLQETTARIRKETAHLKGLKIGIMGCIVNGPGEMADADYGYVGTGPGKINLYKEKTVIRKNVNEQDAVHELIELIKENGDWVDPS
jgi:(E)-4-hydroxy-3-methylbut-2-enyl-diphosphate synthase